MKVALYGLFEIWMFRERLVVLADRNGVIDFFITFSPSFIPARPVREILPDVYDNSFEGVLLRGCLCGLNIHNYVYDVEERRREE